MKKVLLIGAVMMFALAKISAVSAQIDVTDIHAAIKAKAPVIDVMGDAYDLSRQAVMGAQLIEDGWDRAFAGDSNVAQMLLESAETLLGDDTQAIVNIKLGKINRYGSTHTKSPLGWLANDFANQYGDERESLREFSEGLRNVIMLNEGEADLVMQTKMAEWLEEIQ